LALVVTAASVSDRAGAKLLVIRLLSAFDTLKIMWADSGYDGRPLAACLKAIAAITLEVVKRTDAHSFQVVRRRWVVEIGHLWHRSSCFASSWLCSLFLVRPLLRLCPAGAGVEARRACPAFA
jgi:transposase